MQLRKMVVMLTALGAMSLMTACDGDESGTAGLCVSDLDCLGNEICHPDAQVCVSTCTTNSDCPASASTCAPLASDPSVKVCQCSTTEQCNQDRETADQVCSTLDKVCVTACSSNADCGSGRTCDVLTGQCVESSGDPCNGQCQEGETCDTTGSTPTCVPAVGASCEGTAQSTCGYGQFCSSNVCTAAPVAPTSCQNYGSNRPEWNPSVNNGPVIYDITTLKFIEAGNQYCDGATQAEVVLSVRAYRVDQNWPAQRGGVSGFFYLNTDRQSFDVVAARLLVPNTGYNVNPADPKDAEFQVYLCPPKGTNSFPVALYFTDGNPTCPVITR